MTPDEVTNRHKIVLQQFKKSLHLTTACKKLNVTKDKMKLTAIIAEVYIVVDEDSRPVFQEGEALSRFVRTCKPSGTKPKDNGGDRAHAEDE